MKNPYEILGIREGADEEEIKRAYRELVKQYHPDQYQDNPLSKLAEDKLKEINEAYDYLLKNSASRPNTGYSGNSSPNNGYNSNGYDSNGYDSNDSDISGQVKYHISNGNIQMAEEILDSTRNNNAEWYYLKGLVFMRKGWYDEAYTHIKRAVNMDPSNYEYRSALNRMSTSRDSYRTSSFSKGYGEREPDICTICQVLWCADCLCRFC